MKILVIGDSHYGVRGDNKHFYEYQKKFFDNVVFRYIKHYDVKVMVHLGDLVDNRKSINYQSLVRMKEDFLSQVDLETYWIVGNHDAFYTNTLRVNAMDEFCSDIGTIINNPRTIRIGNCSILCVPWICRDNRLECIGRINEASTQFCFGHFELKGFEDNSGYVSTYGEDRQLLERFDRVLSGHFHKRSIQDNIQYIGAPFAFNWSDINQFRGISVFDTETNVVSCFRNPYSIFCVVDGLVPVLDDSIKNKYCRVVFRETVTEQYRNDLRKKIEDIGVISLTFEDRSATSIMSSEETVEGEGLRQIAMRHIDSLRLSNSEQVKEKFLTLFGEAEKKGKLR